MLHLKTTPLTAALLYPSHNVLDFKHLSTTLNLILEPTNIKFRLIHEKPDHMAILSSESLHLVISQQASPLILPAYQRALQSQMSLLETPYLLNRCAGHSNTITLSVGAGPVPLSVENSKESDEMQTLVAQMAINYILNQLPADAVYWAGSNQIMSPKGFLECLNDPVSEPSPPRAPLSQHENIYPRKKRYVAPDPSIEREDLPTISQANPPSFLDMHENRSRVTAKVHNRLVKWAALILFGVFGVSSVSTDKAPKQGLELSEIQTKQIEDQRIF